MINITSWAYYPNPPTYTHNESMNDLLNSNNFKIRLVLWKNFPDHERSINKNSTEMNIQDVPIYYPASKKYKTLLGIGYFSYPSTKVDIEIFNESYSLKDLEKNFHVVAEPTKDQSQKNNIFGFFIKGNENTTSSIRLYNADKKFIKSYYNHFNLQETKFIQPEKNLGVSGMELGIQKISNERFLINYLRFYIFKGDEYKDALPPYNKNINEGSYFDRSKNYTYQLKKIKK
jgi:hypothetical protein